MLRVGRSCCGFNLRVFLSLLEVWVIPGEIMDPIYWNSMNRRFQDAAGYVLYPQIGDRIDLICPRSVPPGPYSTEEYEYYRLYLVTQEQSELCNTVMSPTILLTCDKPDQNTRFTIKFQEFSPNLWGLEFKPNQDYYIITTSEGGEDGLENRKGGACSTKSMRVTLKVGQDPNAPLRPKGPNDKQDHLFPTAKPGSEPNIRMDKENSSVFLANSSGKGDGENGRLPPSNIPLIAGSAGGAAFLLLVIAAIVAVVCYRRRRSKLAESHRPAMHLSTLSSPKRGGGGSGGNNNGSEPSDIIIPLRTSDSAFCPHYEKVSGDYGHPVYIVQEMPPQSPANIYYKSFPDRPVAASEKLGTGGLAQKDGSEKERDINKDI